MSWLPRSLSASSNGSGAAALPAQPCATRQRWAALRLICAIVCAIACAVIVSGCGTRTVYIPHGDPVQLREPVTARIWAFDASGERVAGEVTIPEGWYALPPEPGE